MPLPATISARPGNTIWTERASRVTAGARARRIVATGRSDAAVVREDMQVSPDGLCMLYLVCPPEKRKGPSKALWECHRIFQGSSGPRVLPVHQICKGPTAIQYGVTERMLKGKVC